ncbi:MAG TPA: tetratricopeptide repeat protein [Kofleriaceae bacterium]|nr:tetratricopeptide repeat protein [Kofleriaceae bacterium]
MARTKKGKTSRGAKRKRPASPTPSIDGRLPQRGPTHALDDEAELALVTAIRQIGCFIVQWKGDRRDYGSDVQIEALDGTQVTNCRAHIQLKGTSEEADKRGVVAVKVPLSNLHYLLGNPDSCYVGYHAPSRRLLVRRAEDVYREYERSPRHAKWKRQATISVRFGPQEFDTDFQHNLRARLLASHRSDRDARLSWAAATPEALTRLIAEAPPTIKVPPDIEDAYRLLESLYTGGHDRAISSLYVQFQAALGHQRGRMLSAHMAEINLAMNSRKGDVSRLGAALADLDALIELSGPPLAGLKYNRANCLSVLGRSDDAIAAYRAVLDHPQDPGYRDVAAHCYKNLGTELEHTGDHVGAIAAYEQALRLDPDLAEARLALAHQAARRDDFAAALRHLDGLIRRRASAVDRRAVLAWRAKYRCLAGDVARGIDDAMDLSSAADEAPWIWPWCANIIATFGRSTVEVSRKVLAFWRQYLREHAEEPEALRQRLLCLCHLRMADAEDGGLAPKTIPDGARDVGYAEFRDAAVALMGDKEETALWWDRIGHWAQADGDWHEAEMAYRKAHDLDREIAVYCLGCALSHLGRHEEAIPLLEAAAKLHDDSMGWHQLGVALAGVARWRDAIAAYERAIELDDNEPLPWFNLGGALWNAGQVLDAITVWEAAVEQFPAHPLRANVDQAVDSLKRAAQAQASSSDTPPDGDGATPPETQPEPSHSRGRPRTRGRGSRKA